MLKNKSKLFLENEPLIINWSNLSCLENKSGGSLFFGVGLMSRTILSEGIPFDILSFFFEAERLRQNFKLNRVVILIADTHATSNHTHTEKQINKVSEKTFVTLQKIIRNFVFSNFELIKASDLHQKNSFKVILQKLPKLENKYLKLEIADTLWLNKHKNLKIKLGWAISKQNRVEGNDERFFDNEIIKHCPDVGLIHLPAGKTLGPNRPKASPYLSLDNLKRIIIQDNEDVNGKLKSSSREVFMHFSRIVRTFEKLQGKLPFDTLEEKMKFLINKSLA